MLFCVNFWSTFYITKWIIACVYMICIACQSLTKCLCCLMQFLFCLSWMSCRYMHAINFFWPAFAKSYVQNCISTYESQWPIVALLISFQFLLHYTLVLQFMLSSCVYLNACVSKRSNMGSCKYCCTIAQGLKFSDAKDLGETLMGSPLIRGCLTSTW